MMIECMGQNKILVKINPEGKYVVDLDKEIDIKDCQPNTRVALRNDSYTLHKILPTKVDPLVSLMKVEAVPDSTYDMIGGLEKSRSSGSRTTRAPRRRSVSACSVAPAVGMPVSVT